MLVVWLGIGALVGGTGAAVQLTGPDWAASLVHYAVPYALLVVLVGATAPGPRAAALRSGACFVAFVAVYYGVVAARFGSIPVLYAAAWLGAAIVVCPVAAAVVRWATDRRGVLPGAVFAVAGATALADGAAGNTLLGDPSAVQLVTAPIGLVVALAIVLLVPRRGRTRLAAVVLLVPFALAATWVGWAVHFGAGPYR